MLTRRPLFSLLLIPGFFVLWRCLFAPSIELTGDEAYYWVWSRHLAGGYFDHPPMVAWLIHLSTLIFGSSELAVRLPAILLGAGTIVAATAALYLAGASRKALLAIQFLLLASPLLHVSAWVMTPDIPSFFFTTAAIAAAIYCLRSTSLLAWIALGVFCGAAMLSKYTALLPAATLLAFLLLHNRRNLPRCLLAGLIASAVLVPVLLWNFRHGWISFAFQLGHGMGDDSRSSLGSLAQIVGAQALVATPILFTLMLLLALKALRRGGDAVSLLLSVTGIVSLGFFFLTSLRHKVEANWPLLAWPPLLLLLVLKVQQGNAAGALRKWYRTGLIVAAVGSLALHLPPAVLLRVNRHGPLAKVGGWRALASQIKQMAGELPILAERYQDASWLAFYLPQQPETPLLRKTDGRPTQFDLMPCPVSPGARVLVVCDQDLAQWKDLNFALNGRPVRLQIEESRRLAVPASAATTLERYLLTCQLKPAEEGKALAGDPAAPLSPSQSVRP